MSKKFTLYWSSLDTFEKCPQQFLWSRGWGTIDLGGGPGRPKPLTVKRSRHDAVMGIVIQAVIERMYNDELWREPRGLEDRLLAMIPKEWEYQTAQERNWVDYRVAGTKESLLKVCREGVSGFLRTMKANRLLGEWAKAEFEILGFIDKYNPVGGRADLVFRRADVGVSILDGKNSKTKGRYTNPDQLRWYAMLYYLAYRQLPSRLGFVYYRYPYGTPLLDPNGNPMGEVEQGVDWVEFTKDDLRGLAQRAVTARRAMDKEKFDPTPTPANCKWCDYEQDCPVRQAQKESNRRRPSAASAAAFEGAKGGFVDLDM